MINKIIVYDDNDFELGDYFETSYHDIYDNVSLLNFITVSSINGMTCTMPHLNGMIETFQQQPSIFVGLSHGNEDEMTMHNCGPYIDFTNAHNFKNTLVFSGTCLSGINLGPTLIANGCNAFVGFKDDALATYDEFYHIYTACENYCLKEFLNSDKTLQTTFDEMLTFFDDQINQLFEADGDEVLVGMELQHNKDSLILIGDGRLATKAYYNL